MSCLTLKLDSYLDLLIDLSGLYIVTKKSIYEMYCARVRSKCKHEQNQYREGQLLLALDYLYSVLIESNTEIFFFVNFCSTVFESRTFII